MASTSPVTKKLSSWTQFFHLLDPSRGKWKFMKGKFVGIGKKPC